MEVWKAIEGYEGYYEISNLGRVKSLKRQVKTAVGYRTVTERILIYQLSYGYPRVVLRRENTDKSFVIHRLIALAFIPNPNSFPIINHINGVRNDYRIENLEWCTYSHNTKHAFETGLHDINPIIKMGKENAIKMRIKVRQLKKKTKESIKIYDSISDASLQTDIPISNIVEVCKGRRKSAGGYSWEYV